MARPVLAVALVCALLCATAAAQLSLQQATSLKDLALLVKQQEPVPTLASSLASVSFSDIVGGPLRAVIEAQSQSALASADFITDVGMTPVNASDPSSDRQVVMVNFAYEQLQNGALVQKQMRLPFLTMLPIPYIEVRRFSFNFNMYVQEARSRAYSSVRDVSTIDLTSESGLSVSSFGQSGYAVFGRYSLAVGAVTSRSAEAGVGDTTETYTVDVHVEARASPMPSGTQRLLDILDAITRADIPVDSNGNAPSDDLQ